MIARIKNTHVVGLRTVISVALFSILILAACGSPVQDPTSSEHAEQGTMEENSNQDESMTDAEDATDIDTEESMEESKEMDSEGEEAMDEEAEQMDDSSGSESTPMTDTAEADGEMADGETADGEMADEAMAEDTMDAVDLPAWQQLALVDARTGAQFTLADFSGKTVFVEPMATWCSNCRRQLTNVQEASAQFGDDVVFIALSVETNIAGDELATYADNAGFDYTFAVMTPEMLTELAGAFGQTISNPPATPHFIIRPDGSTTDLVTGIEPAADIVAQLEAIRG